MTEELENGETEKKPGMALAVMMPARSVTAQEVALYNRETRGAGALKTQINGVGMFVGGLTALVAGLSVVVSHGALLPVLIMLGAGGTSGGCWSLQKRRDRKVKTIYDKDKQDVERIEDYIKGRANQVLREAVETGVVLRQGTELPVQLDADRWNVLKIEDIAPKASYDSTGAIYHSELLVTARLHDATRTADGTFEVGGRAYYPEEVSWYINFGDIKFEHTVALKAPVQTLALPPRMQPAPQVEDTPAPQDAEDDPVDAPVELRPVPDRPALWVKQSAG